MIHTISRRIAWKKILLWIFGVACFIELMIIIVASVKNRIINKEKGERESEV